MKIKILLIICLAIIYQSCGKKSKEVKELPKLPNIILCMSDDHGWGDVSYYGHPHLKTPNFDDMAASGLRLDRFYTAGPVCSPTRASVLTGRHPNRMRTFSYGFPIKKEEKSIASILAENGYSTAHFGKWHIGSIRPESEVNPGKMGFDYWLTSSNYFDRDPIFSRMGKLESFDGNGSMILVEEVLDYIDSQEGKGKPLFIVLWFADPHNPHDADEDYEELYEQYPEDLRKYYAEVALLDEAIGELREGLKDTWANKNTLLWYNGDNGGALDVSETGGRGQKGMMYEGGLRVPAIIEWPSELKQAKASSVPVTTMDIFPTILDITGISREDPRPLDGISIRPLIQSDSTITERKIGFWRYAQGINTPESEYMHVMLREQDDGLVVENTDITKGLNKHLFRAEPLKIIRGHAVWLDWPWKLHQIKKWQKPLRLELYNLEDDPMESNNLANQDTTRVKRMKDELSKWQRSVSKSASGMDY